MNNLPNDIKQNIIKKCKMLSQLTKDEILSYLKTLSKKELTNSLNIGTLNFICNEKVRKTNIQKKLNDFNFNNILTFYTKFTLT